MNARTRYAGLALLAAVMGSVVTAQNAGDAARQPRAEDATRAILAAFDTVRVVALGDRHGIKDLNDFTLSLIRHPGFAAAANDIVVEWRAANRLENVDPG